MILELKDYIFYIYIMKTPTIQWSQNDNYIFLDIHLEPKEYDIKIEEKSLVFKQGEYEVNMILYSDDTSTARRAAFNLSWMQEDGLDILKEALFGAPSRRTKTAAAYGLRCMRGRMKKMALDALEQGSKRRNIDVRNVCSHALLLMGRRTQGPGTPPGSRARPRGAAQGPDRRG